MSTDVTSFEMLVRHQRTPSTSELLRTVRETGSMAYLDQALAYAAYTLSQEGHAQTGLPPGRAYQFNIPPKGLTTKRKPLHKTLPETLLELERRADTKRLVGIEIGEELHLTKPQLRVLNELREAQVPLIFDDCLTPYRTISQVQKLLPLLTQVKIGWDIMQAALGSRNGQYIPLARQRVRTLASICADAGITCVAEGVNYERDQPFLREWRISHYQGREETCRVNI